MSIIPMKTALIVVDVQVDFLPKGKLPVPEGDKVLKPINKLIETFKKESLPIFYSRDWHPRNHVSFKTFGEHCVAHSNGALFPRGLDLAPGRGLILDKGTDIKVDSFSAFGASDGVLHLNEFLQEADVEQVFVVGLALDYCVKDTAKDAVEKGYKTYIITEGTKPLTVKGGRQATKELNELGAIFITSKNALKLL